MRNLLNYRMYTYTREVSHHLLYKRLHRCHIDNLKLILVHCTVSINVFTYLTQHGKQGHIGLTCTL